MFVNENGKKTSNSGEGTTNRSLAIRANDLLSGQEDSIKQSELDPTSSAFLRIMGDYVQDGWHPGEGWSFVAPATLARDTIKAEYARAKSLLRFGKEDLQKSTTLTGQNAAAYRESARLCLQEANAILDSIGFPRENYFENNDNVVDADGVEYLD